mgnify:CR=1 FL=1
MRIDKKVAVIEQEYENAGITNESIEMYKEVDKRVSKKIKDLDKLEKAVSKQENAEIENNQKQTEIRKKLSNMRKKHKIKTALAYLPLIGRFGKTAKKYNMLRAKLKRAKFAAKMAKKNKESLKPVYERAKSGAEMALKDKRECQKTLKRIYKVDKYNIEIAKMFDNEKNLLKNTYNKSSLKYIKEYVQKVRDGEKDIELPEGIRSQKDFMKKIKSDLKKKYKGKTVEQLVEENVQTNDNDQTVNKKRKNKNNQTIFAQKGLDLKRKYVSYEKDIDGTKITLEPEQVVNYLGYISKFPDDAKKTNAEDVRKLLDSLNQDKSYKFAERGYDALYSMKEMIKKGNFDNTNLSEKDEIIYDVALKYLEMEEADKTTQRDDKDAQQTRYA